jgi:hypothetical protein
MCAASPDVVGRDIDGLGLHHCKEIVLYGLPSTCLRSRFARFGHSSRALPCGAGSACLIGIGAAILHDLDYDRATILAGYCSGSTLPAKAANALAKRRIYRADNR